MTKLVVINSKGPMGASLLGGFAERLGAVNVPLRQYGLSDYLLGRSVLESGLMQERVVDWISRHSRPIRLGGINVLDRDSQVPKPFNDIERVVGDLDRLKNTHYPDLQSLHRDCFEVFARSVTYKDVDTSGSVFIDFPIDFGEFASRARELYDAYHRNFDDVRMIHLHRDFEGWINAVAVQKFSKGDLSFRLKSWVKHYDNYERAVRELPGLHVDFRELFDTPIEVLARRIGEFTGLPHEDVDWRNIDYDLYGKFVPFDKAFTPVDDGNVYLNHFSRQYFSRYADRPAKVGLKEKVVARLLYLWCYTGFKARRARLG